MTLIMANSQHPNFVGLSTDADNATFTDPVHRGKSVFFTDTLSWKIIAADGVLQNFAPPDASNGSDYSIFGTLETNELEPLVQLDFVYGINTQTGVSVTSNGTVDTANGRLRLQSTTNTAGSAIFRSRKIVRYRPGQGVTARFTAAFTTGKADSTQIVGVGDTDNGYFFGYNGTAFGICHRNGGSDTWVPEASWNGTAVSWTKTNGRPLMIKYPFLGYGNIKFYVQDQISSGWVLVHTIRYANTTATLQLTNPNMYFYAQSLNANNDSNMIVYVGSAGIFLSGKRSFVGGAKWSWANIKSSVTTEANILTLQNATSYNGVANKQLVRLESLSVSASAEAGVCEFRMKIGATLGGSPSYSAINGTITALSNGATLTSANSVVTYDTAGTTVANGTYIFSLVSDNPGTQMIDLEKYNIYLAPGEFLTISGYSSNTSTMGVGINWIED